MTRALKNVNYLGAVMAGRAKGKVRNLLGFNVNSRSSITIYL